MNLIYHVVSISFSPVATVLVLRGELSSGINLISGIAQARIRQLTDSNGKVVKTAHPGMAVTVAGWKELPAAGDEVLQGSEVEIKKAITNRMRRLEEAVLEQDAEAINEQRKAARIKRETLVNAPEGVTHETTKEVTNMVKELRLVIKCDVSGSAEAVVGALEGIGNNLARVKIIQSSVGDVTESDIMMAKAVSGMLLTFPIIVKFQYYHVPLRGYCCLLSLGSTSHTSPCGSGWHSNHLIRRYLSSYGRR